MGRRPKYSRDGAFTGTTAPAASPAERAALLVGWPPSYYCFACHTRRFSAAEIRADYCDQCKAWLAEMEQLWAAWAKEVPKT